jgi:hypothetical protein
VGELTTRREKKRQMVRVGYTAVGVGAVILLIAIVTTSIVLGIFALVVLAIAGWVTRLLRDV